MTKVLICGAFAIAAASFAVADSTKPAEINFVDGAITSSLTGVPGDPEAGRKHFMNRKQGNCLACHVNSDMDAQPFHGEVGPPLEGVSSRWEEAELRGIVVNAKMTFDDTIMPSFYKDAGYTRVLKKFDGKTILTAQQVEDIVAYLSTLTEE